ncbi:uncharacterized protein LOC122879218 isoform X1 [Xyrichtys novacula]|uniref:Uncharacterized protein LOC122879218 isoform X1 n=1 Tax=Xyrichtys novacula TaxID=13765 RepID=A0AAV1FY53_XYRNO|nr:uncharacterized protein LOC122879218 isoform X1 [Xyrichtys novacula]
MSVRHGEQGILNVEAGIRDVEEEEDCLQQFSCCPACKHECEVALILPCSHTMCGPCIKAQEGVRSDQPRGVSLLVCSVLCPCCRHPVELPCWTWSSAISCLPVHPTPSPACVFRETGNSEGAAGDQLHQVERVDTCCHSSPDVTALSCLHAPADSTAACSSLAPEDGDVNLREEEMEQSVYGLLFTLNSSTVPSALHLSKSALTITHRGDSAPVPLHKTKVRSLTSDPRFSNPPVCADVVIRRGQYYWEVDVCNSSVYRIGVSSADGTCGWWLERHGSSFFAVFDGSLEPLRTVPPQIKTLGVFLNISGGALSFHNPLTQEHLATLPTRFGSAGVLPALGLGQGRLRLHCGLPPPPHVFLSKYSTYKGPRGAGGGRWRREVPFQSVRKVIQKFEELAVSDSDSGLVSSFGSSCSTLTSLS